MQSMIQLNANKHLIINFFPNRMAQKETNPTKSTNKTTRENYTQVCKKGKTMQLDENNSSWDQQRCIQVPSKYAKLAFNVEIFTSIWVQFWNLQSCKFVALGLSKTTLTPSNSYFWLSSSLGIPFTLSRYLEALVLNGRFTHLVLRVQ